MGMASTVVLLISLTVHQVAAQSAASNVTVPSSNATTINTTLPQTRYRAPESIIDDFNTFAEQIEELSGRYNEMERHVQNAFCRAERSIGKGNTDSTSSIAVSKVTADLEALGANVRRLEQSLDSLNSSIAHKPSIESVTQIKSDSFRYHEVVTLTDVTVGTCAAQPVTIAGSPMDCVRKCDEMGPQSCRFVSYAPVGTCSRYSSASGCTYTYKANSGSVVMFRTSAKYEYVPKGLNGYDIMVNGAIVAENLPGQQCRLVCALIPECISSGSDLAMTKCYPKTKNISTLSVNDPIFLEGGHMWKVLK